MCERGVVAIAVIAAPTSRRRPPLAAAHQDRTAPRVEVELIEAQRFLDAQAGASEHDGQPASPRAVQTVAGAAHDGDDLLGAGWVGRAPAALVQRRATGETARHRRWRTWTTQRVQRA